MNLNIDILIHIEQLEIDEFGKTTLLIDFLNHDNHNRFINTLGIPDRFPPPLEDDPSMIFITDFEGQNINEGEYYILNPNIIDLLRERLVLRNDSLIIGYDLNYNSVQTDLALSTIDPSEALPVTVHSNNKGGSKVISSLVSVDELIVKNVDQGNWNELRNNGTLKILFDIGTHKNFAASYIKSTYITSSFINAINNDNPTLIISHWDVDHYKCIFGLSTTEISNFSSILFRNTMPNKTSVRAYNLFFNNNKNNIYPIAPDSSLKKRALKILSSNNTILLFNTAPHSNRNKESMSILVDNNNSVALTADLDYYQVSNYIYPEIKNASDNYLVVPHHGGKGGKYTLNLNGTNPKEAIISVGKNNYSHPKQSYITDLTTTGFNVKRTDILKSDYTLNL